MPGKRVKAWTWRRALRDCGPAGSAGRFVPTLVMLSTWMDDSGRAWPSQETIAEGCRLSIRTVRDHIALGAKLNWLHVSVVKVPGRQGWRRHEYLATVPNKLPLDKLDEKLRDCLLADDGDLPEPEHPAMIAASSDADVLHEDRRCGNSRPKVRQPLQKVRQPATEGPAMVAAEVVMNTCMKDSVSEGRARARPRPRSEQREDVRTYVAKLLPVMDDQAIAETLTKSNDFTITPDEVRAIRNGASA